jgi:hypothetical protein
VDNVALKLSQESEWLEHESVPGHNSILVVLEANELRTLLLKPADERD